MALNGHFLLIVTAGAAPLLHSDELKHWHIITAVIYLTKNPHVLGGDVLPGTGALTKGQYKAS